MTMADNANRRAELRKLWFEQFPDEAKRTGNQLLQFTMWLQANRPDLLPKVKGSVDPYQSVKSDLHGHWADPQ